MLTKEQIEQRLNGLFGTDSSALEGTNERFGQNQLFHIKRRNITEKVDPTLAMDMGHDMDPRNIDQTALAIGKKVRRSNRTIWNEKVLYKGKPFLGAHLDGKVVGERTIVECKNVHYRGEARWGQPGTDQIPPNYISQVKHYCLVTGMRNVIFGVLFVSWPEHRLFNISFSEGDISDLYDKCYDFWDKMHKNIEPPVDHTKGCEQGLRKRWPRVIDTEAIVLTDNESDQVMKDMEENKEAIKKLQNREVMLKNKIRQKMEDRSLLVTAKGDQIASYKEDKNGNRVLRFKKNQEVSYGSK